MLTGRVRGWKIDVALILLYLSGCECRSQLAIPQTELKTRLQGLSEITSTVGRIGPIWLYRIRNLTFTLTTYCFEDSAATQRLAPISVLQTP